MMANGAPASSSRNTVPPGSKKDLILGWNPETKAAFEGIRLCGQSWELKEEGEEKEAACGGDILDRRLVNREQSMTITALVASGYTIPRRFSFIRFSIPDVDAAYIDHFDHAKSSDYWVIQDFTVTAEHNEYREVSLDLRRSPQFQPA